MTPVRAEREPRLGRETAEEAANGADRQRAGPELRKALLSRLELDLGVPRERARSEDWLHALALALRERLIARWHETNRAVRDKGLKQVAYLSMEFLVGRDLEAALTALDMARECRAVLGEFGVCLESLCALETDPALGNGGLGRLAACFLDSMANIGVPGTGYGIRYAYGMFRQAIADGRQVEGPDEWIGEINPWEFPRPERTYRIRFGGRVAHVEGRASWIDTHDVLAVAYDRLVPGQKHWSVGTLRLWSPKPVAPIDLAAFNRGAFAEAMTAKVEAETLASVLYPDDSTLAGRELRLRQQYFFVSASVQDVLARFRADYGDWDILPEKVAIHLNDTHPALAPVELMRILVDEERVDWERAWRLVQAVCSYTNHTLLPEALEVWPAELLGRLLPRHLEIVTEIDRRFREELARCDADAAALYGRTSPLQQNGARVNMGRLSVLASHRVNGVSELHSRLVREELFRDFARLYPDRFTNITNGITPRLWLMQCNPGLAALIDEHIGRSWREDLDALHRLAPFAEQKAFLERMRQVKHRNKERLAGLVAERTGVSIDPAAMLDVQVKRIHEYKRQLLNILGVVARWNEIRADPSGPWAPRVVLVAGKAASAYRMAKLIIRLANDVAARINADPATAGRLKFVFLPNFNVSLAAVIMPAADLSEQISLAGMEASGTGNMKLALNGALTLATADGANIEIAEAIGAENVFTFGLTVEEVRRVKAAGYAPRDIYERDARLRRALDQIAEGAFSPQEPDRYKPLVESLLGGDRYLVLADFAAYWDAQREVDRLWADPDAWTRRAVKSVAGMGRFSSDRAIREYAQRIWHAAAI